MNVSRPVIALFLLPLLVGPQARGADPSFQTLDGFNWATAISADGSAVVGKRMTGYWGYPGWGDDYEALRWENGVVTSLGDLPGGDDDSTAYGVSADGSVIVGYGCSDAGQEAVMWDNGVLTSLGVLTGYETSVAYDVSADGTVVVGGATNSRTTSQMGEAWRWEGGVMTGLGLAVGSFGFAQANAVSADGSVVVGHSFGASGSGSFRWDSGVPTTLGSVRAMGVSADGSVVVGGMLGVGAPWRCVDGATTELGLLPGSTTGWATDVSADGAVIVGTVFTGDIFSGLEDAKGFVWTPDGGMRYVGDLLMDDYGLDLDGWMLCEVVAVSDDGQTIVGSATKTVETGFGQYLPISGWIAHIPEPTSLLLLAVGASTVLRRRDRVRWRSVGTAGM